MRTQKEYVRQSQQILRDNGINPYWDSENLAYAPNDGHPANYVHAMDSKLEDAFQKRKSRATIVGMLQDFAQKFIDGQVL